MWLQKSQDNPHIERVRLWLHMSHEAIRPRNTCAKYWRAGLWLKEGTVLVSCDCWCRRISCFDFVKINRSYEQPNQSVADSAIVHCADYTWQWILLSYKVQLSNTFTSQESLLHCCFQNNICNPPLLKNSVEACLVGVNEHNSPSMINHNSWFFQWCNVENLRWMDLNFTCYVISSCTQFQEISKEFDEMINVN